MVTRLKQLLPRQQFVQSLQAAVGNKIIARENIPALKKNVTGHLYGGDRTRKMKLWRKQKLGKEKLQARSRVVIPGDVFRALLKKEKG
jgi:GTP-binding protein LepA